MKSKILVGLLLTILGAQAFANDGGMAAIKVKEIKMRSMQLKNSQWKEEPVLNPHYKIVISGEEASKLQKILPSQVSVVTAMQPEIKDAYNESFKALGVYNKAVKNGNQVQVYPKVLTISCADATLDSDGNGKMRVSKTGQSECVIEIHKIEKDDDAADYFGDAQTFEPGQCSK